jgi:hypothetical protein
MSDQNYTFQTCVSESLKVKLDSVDHAVLTQALPTFNPATAASDLCAVYSVAKPILAVLELLPFFPATWKPAIAQLEATLDVLCPAVPPSN